MTVNHQLAPIVKTVVVSAAPDWAFRAFTDEMSVWWPLDTHSVGAEAAREVRFEGAVGGKIVEYGEDGPIATWGTVSDWDPPSLVSFTWHPGSDPTQATQVTVRFSKVDDGTEVELTHTGWERRPDGARARKGYDRGWDVVLARFTP